MFENYRVAVKISLVNEVSAGILLVAKQFGTANLAAKELQDRLTRIKDLAKMGTYMVGGSMAIAAPFIYAIDKAAELQKQMIGIQVATRGSVTEMDSMRRAIEGVASKTVFSNIDVAKMAKIITTGTGFNAKETQGVLPEYAKFADVQLLMKGTDYQQSVTDAVRLAHTAGKYDPASLSKYLDTLTKASFIIPGDLSEVGHALKYSQGMAKTALGIDDQQMILMTALLNRLGFAGSRGGTNLIAAMTRDIPGVFGSGLLTGKSGEALTAMGMVDAHGHAKAMKSGKFDTFAWMGELSEYIAREFARNPENIAREHIMKNFQHAYGTQGSRVASLLGNTQAIEQLRKIGISFQEYGGVDSIQDKFAKESVAQQYMNAKTNFVSAMTELGITLLPLASRALVKMNSGLQELIKWITDNPEKVKTLSYAFLGLSAAMAIGGTVMLLTSAFRGLAFALSFTGLGGVGGAAGIRGIAAAIGGVGISGTLLGGLGALAVTVGAMAYILTKMDSGDVDPKNHPGMRFQHTGHGGYWAVDRNLSQEHAGQHWKHGSRAGGGTWENDSVAIDVSMHIVPRTNSPVQVTTHLHMDGKKIATAVTQHQSRAAQRPTTGMSGFDPSMSFTPIGAH